VSKGIIYVMTTAVSGLIKIGKTQTKQYSERMRFLEANGYYNVVGLKRLFAIEVADYSEKETLLHEIFAKHRVGSSELFALDYDLVRQLLLSFEGEVVFPEQKNKEAEFDKITKAKMFCYLRAEVLRVAFRVFTDKGSPEFVSILYVAILTRF